LSPILIGVLVVAALAIAGALGALAMGGSPSAKSGPAASAQHVTINVAGGGYDPSVVEVVAGRPVTITLGQGQGCATRFLIPSLGIDKDDSAGPVTFDVGPLKPGTYAFNCPMNMYRGQIVAR
jgi:plastocyanin domain-containing protein